MSADPAIKHGARFTWDDHRTWPDEARWELIGGVAYAMSPAPTPRHQGVVSRLISRIEYQLRGGPCRPFVAPTDIQIPLWEVLDLPGPADPDTEKDPEGPASGG